MSRNRPAPHAVRTLLAIAVGAILAALAAPLAADPDWVARYDGPDGLYDEGAALAVTPDGHLIVVGTTLEEMSSGVQQGRLLVLSYDEEGSLAWDLHISAPPPSNSGVGGQAVAVDGAGRITALGTSEAVLVTQLEPGGQTRWTETFSDPAVSDILAVDLAVDPAGNVYATGEGYGGGGPTLAVSGRYSPEGVAAPLILYGGPLDSSSPEANAVTAAGELVVAGATAYEGLAHQFSVVLFDAAGQVAWEYQHGGEGSATEDRARDVLVAGSDVLATGYVNGNTATNEDVWTVRLDAAGQVVWSHQYTTGPTLRDVGRRLGTDAEGNVFVGGHAQIAPAEYDALVLKYDATGNLAWDRRYTGTAVGFESVSAVVADGEGGVWAAGSIEIDLGVSAYFVVHYDTDGDLVGEEIYAGPMGGGSQAFDLVAGGAGSLYVTGRSLGVDSDFDAATLRLSSAGPLFADGFESGDLSHWSAAVQ